MSIRTLLVDDHNLFLEGLKGLLLSSGDVTIAGEAADAPSAIALAAALKPELVILDLHLPGARGLEVARQLLALSPAPRILILTGAPDMQWVPEAVQLGVLGFLRKDATKEELHTAIVSLRENKTYLCSDAAAAVFNSIRNPSAPAGTHGLDPTLSERERQVLALVAKGFRNKEIADQIGTSIKSVETYRARVMTKLNVNSTAELMRYAVQHGL